MCETFLDRPRYLNGILVLPVDHANPGDWAGDPAPGGLSLQLCLHVSQLEIRN